MKKLLIVFAILISIIFLDNFVFALMSDKPSEVTLIYDNKGKLTGATVLYKEMNPYNFKSPEQIRTTEQWQEGFCPYCFKELGKFIEKSCTRCHNEDRTLK